jgi:hypothetical protein
VQTLKKHCQCTGLQEASGQVTNGLLIVASVLLLCLLFLSQVPNTMHIINIYLFMSEDNPLLLGAAYSSNPVMIQVNSLLIVMHSVNEGWDDQTTLGY